MYLSELIGEPGGHLDGDEVAEGRRVVLALGDGGREGRDVLVVRREVEAIVLVTVTDEDPGVLRRERVGEGVRARGQAEKLPHGIPDAGGGVRQAIVVPGKVVDVDLGLDFRLALRIIRVGSIAALREGLDQLERRRDRLLLGDPAEDEENGLLQRG